MRKIILIAGLVIVAVLTWTFWEKSRSKPLAQMTPKERSEKALAELHAAGHEDLASLVALLATADWKQYQWSLWKFSKANPSLRLNLTTPVEIRGQALLALGKLGTNALPAVPAILPLLLREDLGSTGASALIRIGAAREAIPYLWETSTNANPDVRRGCVILLRDVIPTHPPAAAIARNLTRDSDSSVQINAIQSLQNVPGDITAEALALAGVVNDADPMVREAAIGILCAYGRRTTNAQTAILTALETRTNRSRMETALENCVYQYLAPKRMRPLPPEAVSLTPRPPPPKSPLE